MISFSMAHNVLIYLLSVALTSELIDEDDDVVHSAYDSFELLNNCPIKIDVVELYGSKLLFDCSDGSLKIYAPESFDSDCPPTSDYHV
ncbi:hypothetical protein FH972_008017 [Carpinus fangiana]|uniref:Uncharacterized protein n=1 Tax=Carpinus fangiana TaxID=176857 RepID=A0A5N6QXB0_9ROSI|nr:hypothetical protein FH972_008017 [Carpinus fangiana]